MDLNNKVKYFKLLTTTAIFNDWTAKSCPDSSPLQARLVFSWLAFRSRNGHGASTRSICQKIGLHPATVATALNNLATLITRRDKEWVAIEPPEGLFVPRRCDQQPKHWSDRFAYMMLYLPRRGAKIVETSRRFGLNHALIWSFLSRNASKVGHFTFAGAAKLFDLDPKTVANIINDLIWLKMIERQDIGRCSEIKLLPFTENHLALFQPKPITEPKKVQPVAKKPCPSSGPYQFKGDKWDDCRKKCEGLMAQHLAESLIIKAKQLNDTPEDFENQFIRAKGFHDKNILNGKVAKGNFGSYLKKCYDTRIEEQEKQRRAFEEQLRLEAYYLSDEYKAKWREIEKAAAADPSHRFHTISQDSIIDRVRFDDNWVLNWREADKLYYSFGRHVKLFVDQKKLPTQESVDLLGSIRNRILRLALSTLNHYYKQPTLATSDQLKEAIDAATQKVEPKLQPFFGKEVTYA